VATAHSRGVFSISIQEINIWIFSNLVLNLSPVFMILDNLLTPTACSPNLIPPLSKGLL
jgi:hypothetical protein